VKPRLELLGRQPTLTQFQFLATPTQEVTLRKLKNQTAESQRRWRLRSAARPCQADRAAHWRGQAADQLHQGGLPEPLRPAPRAGFPGLSVRSRR